MIEEGVEYFHNTRSRLPPAQGRLPGHDNIYGTGNAAVRLRGVSGFEELMGEIQVRALENLNGF